MSWITPLARAERILTTGLMELERRLPDKEITRSPEWEQYVRTVEALTRVLERLRPLRGMDVTTADLADRKGRRL